MLSLAFLELTLRDVLSDVPRDGGALAVFLLMLAMVAVIWHGSRSGRSTPPAAPRPRLRDRVDPSPLAR